MNPADDPSAPEPDLAGRHDQRDAGDDALAHALRASRSLHDAPAAVLQRALEVFDRRPVHAPAATGPLQRLVAALRFDSAGHSPLAFGRRASGAGVRQLVYTVDACDVDLRVDGVQADGHFTLSGQVLGPEASGVMLLQGEAGGVVQAAVLSELGEFRLTAVPPGRYRMTLEMAGMAVELPALQLPLA